MLPEIYWIPEVRPLKLAILARPRSGEWLVDEITGWQQVGINTVVSMLEVQETRELGLMDESSLCEQLGLRFVSYAIADRGVPASTQRFAELVNDLVRRLRYGDAVGIHCRASIGRAGLMAASVLACAGVTFDSIFPMLSKARKAPVPDTPEQIAWVKKFTFTIKREKSP